MSDEELDLGEVGGEEEEPEGGRRGGGLLAGLLTKLLLWGAVGLGFIILGVTTTVITLNVVGRGRTQAPAPQSAEYQGRPEPLMYYDNIEAIRGVTADENPAVFSVRVSIGYVFDNDVNKELIDRQREGDEDQVRKDRAPEGRQERKAHACADSALVCYLGHHADQAGKRSDHAESRRKLAPQVEKIYPYLVSFLYLVEFVVQDAADDFRIGPVYHELDSLAQKHVGDLFQIVFQGQQTFSAGLLRKGHQLSNDAFLLPVGDVQSQAEVLHQPQHPAERVGH